MNATMRIAEVAERSGLELGPAAPLDQLALLMRAEQGCCSFFALSLTVDHSGIALEVRAPEQGRAMVGGLFG